MTIDIPKEVKQCGQDTGICVFRRRGKDNLNKPTGWQMRQTSQPILLTLTTQDPNLKKKN